MKKRLCYIAIAIILLGISFGLRLFRYYPTAAEKYAHQVIKGAIANNINKTLANELTKYDLDYNQLTNIAYSSNGDINSITLNAVKLNIIANHLSETIYNSTETNSYKFGIPLGNALGSRLFADHGPTIETEVKPIGAVEYEIRSELSEGGINQTLHRRKGMIL